MAVSGAQRPSSTPVVRVTRANTTVDTRRVGRRDPVTRAISYPRAFLSTHHKQYICAFSPSLALFRTFWNVLGDASTPSRERDRHSQFSLRLARSSIKHQTQACRSPKLHWTSQEHKIVPEPSCIFALRCVFGHASKSLPPIQQCRLCRSPQARAHSVGPRTFSQEPSLHPVSHPNPAGPSISFPSFPANLLVARRSSRHVAPLRTTASH